MRLLATGFAPFGGETRNPSWEAARTLAGDECVAAELPVSYDRVGPELSRLMALYRPDAVLLTGQAGGRAEMTVEYAALNVMDAGLADNDGVLRRGDVIEPGGPAACLSTLPVRAMVDRMRARGVPASVSYTAGAFVCNCALYRLLRLLEAEYPGVRGGFVHVPFDTAQVCEKPGRAAASMPLALIAEGLRACADAIRETR